MGGANVSTNHPMILLADHEPSLRDFLSITLRRAEYEVLAVINAADALALLRATPRIDLVLADVQMGDGRMDGFELAAEIMTQRPSVPVVIMSGVPDNKRLALEKGLPFLSKPFTPAAVVQEIRHALLHIRPQSDAITKSRSKAG